MMDLAGLVRQDAAVLFHDLLYEVGAANDAFTFGDQVILGHIEKVEIRRTAKELRTCLVGVLDKTVNGLR